MAVQEYKIDCKSFEGLTNRELYQIMRLRSEVFVVEQHCIYLDADNKDPYCHHLMVWEQDQLVAYARLLPKGLAFENYSIGRVISSSSVRGKGIGRLLVAKAIENCTQLFGAGPITIGAQLYLQAFYASFGFEPIGEVYLEDDIKHIEMQRPG